MFHLLLGRMASSSSSSSSSKFGLFQFLIILCSLLEASAGVSFGKTTLPDIGRLKSCKIDKIYQFGASKSDTGSRRLEDPLDRCNLPPYGQSYLKEPTGRCSDGLLMIDYIATAAGLPLLNPYLNSKANFIQGVDFAVGGATALPVDALEKRNIIVPGTKSSLGVQIQWMFTYFGTYCNLHHECSPGRIKNALFIVGETGDNDYTSALFQSITVEEAKSRLMPQIVRSIINAVKRVISIGAKRIIVPGEFPLGCFPVFLTIFETNSTTAYDENECLKDLNDLAVAHNVYLQHSISKLQKENPNTRIVYGDYYNAYKWLLNNATYLGLDAATSLKACCGTGGKYNFNLLTSCGSLSGPVCSDPDRHISWDETHLTQKANSLIATWLVADFVPKIDCNN